MQVDTLEIAVLRQSRSVVQSCWLDVSARQENKQNGFRIIAGKLVDDFTSLEISLAIGWPIFAAWQKSYTIYIIPKIQETYDIGMSFFDIHLT